MARASARTNRNLLVFGEFFLDLVFYDLPEIPRLGEEVKTASFAPFPGGGLSTTALVAANLGTPTEVITRIGQEARKSPQWQKLEKAGITTECCEFDRRLPTAITVCAAYGGDRMMVTHDAINVHLEKLLVSARVRKRIRRAAHLHLACALDPPRVWHAIIRKLRKHGLTISADIGWNPGVLESPQLIPLLKELVFTFPNESEAKKMTGARTVEQAAMKLARWVRVPVIKLGRDGSLAVRDGKLLRMKSIRARSVDATGAGDAFNGGFLHGYLAGWPLENCMRAGNVCGALATTRPGGSSAIPTPRKLRALMRSI